MTGDTGIGPSPSSGADIRTFLFADIRGYTRYTQEHGDDAASALAGRFADLVRESVPTFEGELLELRGDEALCVFRSARQAVRASVELQRRLRTATDSESAFPIGVGMGLDAGEAVPTQGGYRGAALNRAARLCSAAKGGEILATEGVSHLTGQVPGARMSPVRVTRVRGIAAPVRFVGIEPVEQLPPAPAPSQPRRSRGWLAAACLAALVVAAGVAVLVGTQRSGHNNPVIIARPSSVVEIDPRTGRVLADYRVPVGTILAPLVYADGSLWTYNQNDQTLIQIDPRTGRSQRRGIGVAPTDLAVSDGYEWIADGPNNLLYRYQWQTPGPPTPIQLPKLTASYNFFGHQRPSFSGQVAAHGGEVWATAQGVNWPQTIAVYDASTLQREHVYRLPILSRQIGDVEAGPAGVWMENRIHLSSGGEKAALVSLDPRLGHPLYVMQGSYLQEGVAVASQSVWFAPGSGRTVVALNPATGARQAVVTLNPVTAVAAGPAGVWAAASRSGTIFELDQATQAARHIVHLHAYISGLAVTPTRVWALIQTSPIETGYIY